MSTQQPHTKLLISAAREWLRPLGLVQKGRSRIWFDDQGWWLGLVEFQPSGFSKGSYLNVAVQWLWEEVERMGVYHVPGRLRGFTEFESEEQFEPEAQSMARDAANQIRIYRSLFASFDECADYFRRKGRPAHEELWHGGVALALAGSPDEAERWFDAYLCSNDDRDWAIERRKRVRKLKSLLGDETAFHDAIEGTIRGTRLRLQLDPERPIGLGSRD